jgi:putative transcriptional regulator
MTDINNSILQGAKEALAHAKGKLKGKIRQTKVNIPKSVDVHAIRDKLHLSRQAFCDSFGFSTRTVEKWEQGTRTPEGAARAYLTVIEHNPDMVQKALNSYQNNDGNHIS